MKKSKYLAMAVIVMVAIIWASGCLGQKSSTEYFPANSYSEWTYKIDLGSADPKIYYTIVYNPIIRGFASDELAERPIEETIISEAYKKEFDCCFLRFRVGRTGTANVNNKGVRIAELKIIQDDLGLYGSRNPLNHSWAMTEEPEGLRVVKMAIVPAREFGLVTPNMIVNSAQLVFFIPNGNEKEREIVDGDRLKLLGYDNDAPGCKDAACMHFKRTVALSGITEDTWFAPGKGMVRLEQKVNGEPSMTWTLENVLIS